MQAILKHAETLGFTPASNESHDDFCLRLIVADIPWPADMTNDEGWRLTFARLRLQHRATRAEWEDDPGAGKLTLKVFNSRGQEVRATIEIEDLKGAPFGRIVTALTKEVGEKLEALARVWDAKQEEFATEFEDVASDLTEYVIGFRTWRMSDANDSIDAFGWGTTTWEGGKEVRAVCERGLGAQGRTNGLLQEPHYVPHPDCECGLYAYHSVADAIQHGSGEQRVVGVVRARGRIQSHPVGFRTEFAQPILFGYVPENEDRVKELGAKLGVRTVPLDTLLLEAEQFGSVVPDDMRGAPDLEE